MRTLFRIFAAMLWSASAAAHEWDFSGAVENCDAFACSVFGLKVADPLTGFMLVDESIGPNHTFSAADVVSHELSIGSLDISQGNRPITFLSVTTDASEELVSGVMVFQGTADTGIGIAELEVTIDVSAGTFSMATDFLGIGEVASGSFSSSHRPSELDFLHGFESLQVSAGAHDAGTIEN